MTAAAASPSAAQRTHRTVRVGARDIHLTEAGILDGVRALDDRDALVPMLAPDPRITDLAAEGQILGFGHDAALRAAMPRTGDGPMP